MQTRPSSSLHSNSDFSGSTGQYGTVLCKNLKKKILLQLTQKDKTIDERTHKVEDISCLLHRFKPGQRKAPAFAQA